MLFGAIALLFLMLAGGILAVAGTVFNWVVIRTVFQFGEYFGTSAGMLDAWGVMRDIANIGLLFSFIFMGVLLILNVDGGGNGHGGGMSAKKAIPRLIIFAVLMNFSLFASQAVIDVANAFSSSFATLAGQQCKEATSGSSGEGATGGQAIEECVNVGIAGQILEVAGMTKLFDVDAMKEGWDNLVGRPYQYTISLIMLSIFVLVTAMVLLAGSIMLIIRVVILSLLMVTSPIGFAGMVIPKLQGVASMWWSKLFSQAFFAPVYLLLIFISIKLTEGLTGDGDATLASAMIGNKGATTAGNMQVVMVYMIVIGFMIGSLIAASKMGAMGAKFATSAAAGMTVGTVGFVGRRTVGRMSASAASGLRRTGLAETGFGKQLIGVADYGSKASFSLRNASSGSLGKLGVDIGKANKTASHGYHGIEEKVEKDRLDYAKSLKGDRQETAKETRERVAAENAALSETRATADTNVDEATQGEVAAGTAATAAETARTEQLQHLRNSQTSLAAQRILVAQNPDDLAAQTELLKAEDQLAKEQQDLARADQTLSQANQTLAQATAARAAAVTQQTEAQAATANTGRGNVSEVQRQINYADGVARDPFTGITLSRHLNHDVAKKIRDYANSSPEQRRLEALTAALKKAADKDGAAPTTGPGPIVQPPH